MPSRRAALVTLAFAGIGAACRGGDAPPATAASSLDDLAERYVRLTLALAQHQPSLVETWLGPEAWHPGRRGSVAPIREAIAETLASVRAFAAAPDETDRRRYLDRQLSGLLVAARRLAGESMRFFDESRAAMGVGPDDARVDERAAAAARAALDMRLAGRGPLHARVARFRRRHAIGPERVPSAFQAAVAAIRSRVLRHIDLLPDEHVSVERVAGLGFEARAVYTGGFRTEVSLDQSASLDLARLVWLAAHETYPGHHVQHVLADRDLVITRGWHERALHARFGRHLLVAEGAAEAGAALLLDGDAFDDLCREVALVAGMRAEAAPDLVAVHRGVLALDLHVAAIAQAYLDGETGSEEASERLAEAALVSSPRDFLGVIERQRTGVLAYPVGRRLVAGALAGVPAGDGWRRLARIATVLDVVS